MMSDILFFDEVVSRDRLEEARRSGLHGSILLEGSRPIESGTNTFIPAVDQRFRRREDLTAVFEVYNPGRRSGEKDPRLKMQCRILKDGTVLATAPVRSLDYLTQLDDSRRELTRTAYGLSIPLRTLRVGEYVLEFEVHDEVLEKRLSKTARFSIY